MKKKKYKSGVDTWILCILFFTVVIVWVCCIGTTWLVTLPLCGSLTFTFVFLFLGCWYEIDGDQLVVYQFFMAHKFPIKKIREVKKTTGYLATAGMSTRRVSIRFTDRSVMKSYMPLEISPTDRDGFIAHLRDINPDIVVPE